LLNDLPDNLRNELSNELAEKEEAKTDGWRNIISTKGFLR
jgi:hypothetical protein